MVFKIVVVTLLALIFYEISQACSNLHHIYKKLVDIENEIEHTKGAIVSLREDIQERGQV